MRPYIYQLNHQYNTLSYAAIKDRTVDFLPHSNAALVHFLPHLPLSAKTPLPRNQPLAIGTALVRYLHCTTISEANNQEERRGTGFGSPEPSAYNQNG